MTSSREECLCLRVVIDPQAEGTVEGILCSAGHEVFEVRHCYARTEILVYGSDEDLACLRARLEREPGVVRQLDCAAVDDSWKTGWVEHLEPCQLTPEIRVVAEGPQARPGDLVLARALAFGYGEHATTRLAARWLEAQCNGGDGLVVLDVGCGTGVLSLLAGRLGARAIGLDISREAVASATENADRNGLSQQCQFLLGGPERLAGGTPFETAVVNIEAGPLCALAPAIANVCSKAPALGVTGLLLEQADSVRAAFARVGLELAQVAQEGPWQLLSSRASESIVTTH